MSLLGITNGLCSTDVSSSGVTDMDLPENALLCDERIDCPSPELWPEKGMFF